MQWEDVKYGDDATPEQMNTVAHGVMAVEEWLNQIVGLPSMSGNKGYFLTNDGTNAIWDNTITSNTVNEEALEIYGEYGQISDIFKIDKWATEEHSSSFNYFKIDTVGTVYTKGLTFENGYIFTKAFSSSYGNLSFTSAGTLISRNIADSFAVLRINNANSASTGNIVEFLFAGTTKAYVTKDGSFRASDSLYSPYLCNYTNTSYGALYMGGANSSIQITRTVADANPVLVVNNNNAASTGHLLDLRMNRVNKTYFDRYGNIYSSGFNLQIETSMPPESATSDGLKGSIRWDEDYIYVCTAENTWKRTSLTTW